MVQLPVCWLKLLIILFFMWVHHQIFYLQKTILKSAENKVRNTNRTSVPTSRVLQCSGVRWHITGEDIMTCFTEMANAASPHNGWSCRECFMESPTGNLHRSQTEHLWFTHYTQLGSRHHSRFSSCFWVGDTVCEWTHAGCMQASGKSRSNVREHLEDTGQMLIRKLHMVGFMYCPWNDDDKGYLCNTAEHMKSPLQEQQKHKTKTMQISNTE